MCKVENMSLPYLNYVLSFPGPAEKWGKGEGNRILRFAPNVNFEFHAFISDVFVVDRQ